MLGSFERLFASIFDLGSNVWLLRDFFYSGFAFDLIFARKNKE